MRQDVASSPLSVDHHSKLADRLRFLLEARGLSQRELAHRAHVSEANLSRLLSGEQHNPTTRTLQALAQAFGVNVRTVLGEAVEAPVLTSDSEELLMTLYRLLLPEQQARIAGYAEAIASRYRPECVQQGRIPNTPALRLELLGPAA